MICLAKDDKSFVAKEKSNSTKYEIVISLEKWKHFIEFSNRNHLAIIINAQLKIDLIVEEKIIIYLAFLIDYDQTMPCHQIQ